jgi:hypothetical protein
MVPVNMRGGIIIVVPSASKSAVPVENNLLDTFSGLTTTIGKYARY